MGVVDQSSSYTIFGSFVISILLNTGVAIVNLGGTHSAYAQQSEGLWKELGGSITSSPSAVATADDRVLIFVRAHDGQLMYRELNNNISPTEWKELGGSITSSPSAVATADNRVLIFVRA